MYLIDKPYISEFLLDTIRENNYKIIATREAKELVTDSSLNWISEEEAILSLKNNPLSPLYEEVFTKNGAFVKLCR